MSVVDVMLTPRQCAEVLRALGDETRLRILESLLVEEKCVSDMVKEIRKAQPHVSHHLRILRDAGLIEGVREGKRICYRVSPRMQLALKSARRQALDFGCCRISFPDTVLAAHVG
ncbi:MAG: ArsR/SmtB family transcription factor [Nitrospiraceae bacterium]